MGEADSNEYMRLRKQLVIAADNMSSEENSSPLLKPKMSKDKDDQLKLTQKMVHVVQRAHRKF